MTRAKALLLSKGKRMNNTMSDAILTQYRNEAFDNGVRYALEYLSDLIDGLDETDLWGEYMNEEAN